MSDRILVTKSSMPPMEEYFEEVAPLWESHWLTNMGVEHKSSRRTSRSVWGIDNLCSVHEWSQCSRVHPRGHGSSDRRRGHYHPVHFCLDHPRYCSKGPHPVFADVNPVNLTLDPESIERLITPRTCAIVPVHVYGNLCDVDAIQEIADRHGLKVIYDAAHAFGVERVNEDGSSDSAATFGDAAMFSFHATKVFNTIEGGCVCFKDEDLYPLLNQWKNFGITGPEDVE